ncbi:helix-turn-helix transcriptional regulator [Paractinoplanes durhamensis]|uniref:helix-turn-helix transcriptional regulator n=1 Tax=Paractinoplanes durhamensis TaxID=113563 RepID=UPI001943A854|nr:LuxR family transcriptional regulator [Actinoplanes durhamensis]
MPFRTLADQSILVGREGHCRVLDGLVAAAAEGHGGLLVLAGEPGIGKTALLTYALAAARGATTLATTGLESEAALPYAGLGDLLRPLLDLVPKLPGPQARALRAALALEEHETEISRYAVCMATLSLLTIAADQGPVLLVVDDAHWIDRPSLAALLFAGRRLAADPVAMVVAAHDTALDDLDAAHLDVLRVAGLDHEATGRLLDRLRPDQLPPGLVTELWRATGGNPLALADAADSLTGTQLAGVAPLPDPLPIRAGLHRAFAARLAPLPAATRGALLVVALSGSAEAAGIHAALDTIGAGRAALDHAEQAGMIRRAGGRVAFTHPLLRSVVQRTATPAARRRVFDALAATSTGGERAWYLAADVGGLDEPAAAELERAADEMRRRAGYTDAARALHRAAELTAPARRARLLFAAAVDAQRAGDLTEAAAWLDEARLLVDDPLIAADIALALGRVLARRGTAAIAQRVLVGAADTVETADPRRAAGLLSAAVDPALTEGRIHDAVAYARRAVALDAADGGARIVLAEALMFAGELGESRVLFAAERDRLDQLDPLADADTLVMLGLCRGWLEEYESATAVLGRVIDAARDAGALSVLIRALAFDAEVRRCTGEWSVGYAEAEEALRLARELHEVAPVGFALVGLARFDAACGRHDAALERLAEAARIAGPLGTPGLLIFAGTAEGLVHLVAGDHDRAIACLDGVREFTEKAGLGNPDFLPWCADLIEAYWRAGRSAEARELLTGLEARAGRSGLGSAGAAAARCRAILATDPGEAEWWFREALRRHDLRPQPFEAARTRLLAAEVLRRRRRRVEARALLHEALPVFDRLGCEPFARRASAELAAAGERGSARTPSVIPRLTAQELQVAQAVADGMSNPEVAAALFISRKTVESHLTNAYRKLGLHSRTQLVRHLAQNGQNRGDGSGSRAATDGSA